MIMIQLCLNARVNNMRALSDQKLIIYELSMRPPMQKRKETPSSTNPLPQPTTCPVPFS